jgi:hypothetical protein
MPADPDLTAWRAELLDLASDLVAELGRLRGAVEVLAGEALDRQIAREAREASIDAHPSSTPEGDEWHEPLPPHRGLSGSICGETSAFHYDDGTIECRRCGRTLP